MLLQMPGARHEGKVLTSVWGGVMHTVDGAGGGAGAHDDGVWGGGGHGVLQRQLPPRDCAPPRHDGHLPRRRCTLHPPFSDTAHL